MDMGIKLFNMSPDEMTVLHTIILVVFLSPVNGQPLDQPAENFPCGSLKCDRWGYTACVNPDGEFYCIPCYEEYVSSLCGKKDQLQGCNLYCTQKKLKDETEKLRQEFSKEMKDVQNNFTAILKEETYLSQNQTQQHQKDVDHYLTKIKTLEVIISEKNRTIVIYQALFWIAFLILSFGCLVIWVRKHLKCNQTVVGLESDPEKKNLMNKNNDGSFPGPTELSFSTENAPVVNDNSTQPEDYTEVNDQNDGQRDDTAASVQCSGSYCPGKDLLQNVPPTNDRDGCDKMAIRHHDAVVSFGKYE